ncbi:DNA-binding NarL/FixJ family response regulator [Nocardioides ginsengisegetis]|uniref:DNA-binding NarL/FixJ family response regulator n=1 Tax=Nocardioides ginsengisegetis TaxID=661491 RepID=A0A7W3J3F2_9ACTN|nr:response regulator transcription factor [Nocardioides ginsengisegetis]MBA8805419.1 DNA-binding NarL/FixJ family response regulator [Nocardioides ginsengisegetis]
MPLRIAVLNDYELVVAGIAAVLRPFSDRVLVVELDSRMPVVSDVDIVLHDTFGQVQGDALDVEELVQHGTARLVVFSWNLDPGLIERAVSHGVAGYLSKGLSGEEIVDALERIAAGERVLPDPATRADEDFGRWPGDTVGLSARESEMLALIVRGLPNKEIAIRAGLSINSVKTYIRTAYRKIGVTTRAQAVVWAMAHGFEPDRFRAVRTPPS